MPKLPQLKEVMKSKEISQADLSKKTGLSVKTIWNAEQGKSISMTTAKLIGKALGVKLEELR